MSKNQNYTGQQQNNSMTSFKGKKIANDEQVGAFGDSFKYPPEEVGVPTKD